MTGCDTGRGTKFALHVRWQAPWPRTVLNWCMIAMSIEFLVDPIAMQGSMQYAASVFAARLAAPATKHNIGSQLCLHLPAPSSIPFFHQRRFQILLDQLSIHIPFCRVSLKDAGTRALESSRSGPSLIWMMAGTACLARLLQSCHSSSPIIK